MTPGDTAAGAATTTVPLYYGPQLAPLPESQPQRVSVTLKRSSTKDAGEGFDISVVGYDSTEAEADRVMALAIKLRTAALEAISKPPEA